MAGFPASFHTTQCIILAPETRLATQKPRPTILGYSNPSKNLAKSCEGKIHYSY
jgi:hypothetical protein